MFVCCIMILGLAFTCLSKQKLNILYVKHMENCEAMIINSLICIFISTVQEMCCGNLHLEFTSDFHYSAWTF